MLRITVGRYLKRAADSAKGVPQRLKPQLRRDVYGTAEAVPLSNAFLPPLGVPPRLIFSLIIGLLLVLTAGHLWAETVATLPAPTAYVNDFAGVLQPGTKQQLEALCTQVDQKAKAQIAVVTINKIDSDQSIEEFAVALEEKWKVGAKGTDKGVLMLFVMNPRGARIEVGYGLEGILPDAKVGAIGDSMGPAARTSDYNTAIPLGVNAVAQAIATDAGVTLTQGQVGVHHYHEQQVGTPVHLSFWQVVIGGVVILIILIVLVSTGNAGWIFFLLMNMMGGGGGGGGGRDNDRGGGGFGGFGGGSSGGGGASGDW